jgi:ABC-type Fe3+ transport system substrate-binding protein
MFQTRRRTRLSVSLAAAVLLLAACGGQEPDADSPAAAPTGPVSAEMSKLISDAKAEGSLTWYSAIPLPVDEAVAKGFTDKYGIKVEIFNVSTGALAVKYTQERAAGTINADAINLADPTFFKTGNDQKWWTPLTKELVPSLGNYPEKYVYPTNSVLIGTQPIGIAYNKNLVNPAPTSWEDLLDPRFKGQLLITDPSQVPVWMATFKMWNDELGPDFLTKLAAQEPAFVGSSNPGAQQVGVGEKWVNIPTSLTALNDLISKGAPIGYAIPSPTTGVEMTISLSEGAKNPNAARLFVDFVLSPEGQALINAKTGASVLPNIPGTLEYPKDYVAPDIAAAQAEKAQLLAPFGR